MRGGEGEGAPGVELLCGRNILLSVQASHRLQV